MNGIGRRGAAVLALGGGLLVLFSGVALLGDARARAGTFLALALAAGVLHLAATAFAWRLDAGRRLFLAIVSLAVLFRAALLCAPPTLSDDVWRYVWEGRVQAAGFDPYRLAPDAEALAHLRDAEVHPRINNPEIPAVYPPGHELVLRGVAAAGGGALALRLVSAAADVATGLLVAFALRAAGKPTGRAVAHLFCPLGVIEFAGSGHGDSLFLLALVASIVLVRSGRKSLAAVALGLSVALRAVPAILVPVFFRPLGARLAIAALAATLPFVPYAFGEPRDASPFRGANEYAKRWRHNDSAFRGLLAVSEARLESIESGGPLWMRERVRDHRDDFNPLTGAKSLAAAAFAAGLAAVVCLRRSLATSVLLALFLLLLLSTTVHPWYVTWLVPFAALSSRPAPALVFSSTVFLAYHVFVGAKKGEPWAENDVVVAIEYAPVYAALLWEALRAMFPRREERGAGAGS